MKVKVTTSIAGNGFAHQAGDVAEFPDAEARSLIEHGLAVPMREEKVERAVAAKTTERAVKR